MALNEYLLRNRSFLKESGSRTQGKWTGPVKLLLVGCSCPELTGVLEPSLGLHPGEAGVVRVAGAWGGKNAEELLRSVLLGLHTSQSTEILVVGHSPCACCEANITRSGAGPVDPKIAVIETAEFLRRSRAVPTDVAVNGGLLDRETGVLQVVYRDPQGASPTADARPAPGQESGQETTSAAEDFPLPLLPEILLPEISLPEIAALDLDLLCRPNPPPKKTSIAYGSQTAGVGPISLGEIQKMPESVTLPTAESSALAAAANATGTGWQTPRIEFEIPKAPEIRDTGLAPYRIGEVSHPPTPEPPPARSTQELAAAQPPARPSQARKATAGQAYDSNAGVEIDLINGAVRHGGTEQRLPPDFQQALVRVQQFLGSELDRLFRDRIATRIRAEANNGQTVSELLKLMIGPVIKLGQKRYSVINELLKLKEELPRQERRVAVALIDVVLRGES